MVKENREDPYCFENNIGRVASSLPAPGPPSILCFLFMFEPVNVTVALGVSAQNPAGGQVAPVLRVLCLLRVLVTSCSLCLLPPSVRWASHLMLEDDQSPGTLPCFPGSSGLEGNIVSTCFPALKNEFPPGRLTKEPAVNTRCTAAGGELFPLPLHEELRSNHVLFRSRNGHITCAAA